MGYMGGEIDVLAVDDQENLLELAQQFLERSEDDLNVETTTNPREVLEVLEEDDTDAIVSDYNMPVMNGLELLEEVREFEEDFPFILYTGKGSEEVAAEAVNLGATDYFQKETGTDHYQMIAARIVDSVENYRKALEREAYESIVENSDNPIVITDTDPGILFVNDAFEEITGYKQEEVIGENPKILNSGKTGEREFEEMYNSLASGEIFKIDGMINVKKDGEEYSLDQQFIPIEAEGGEPGVYVAISRLKDK